MATSCFIIVLAGLVSVQFRRDLFHCFLTSSASPSLKNSVILSLSWTLSLTFGWAPWQTYLDTSTTCSVLERFTGRVETVFIFLAPEKSARTEEAKQVLVGVLESLLTAFNERFVDFSSIDYITSVAFC